MHLSIIIPTLNEEEGIGPLLDYLLAQLTLQQSFELLIIDGGSKDNTVKEAQKRKCTIVKSSAGRGRQLHAGAQNATGDVLYFLHADTFPPSQFYEHIETAIEAGSNCGCFRLKFTPSHWLLQFYELFVPFQSIVFRGGDQSLFVTAKTYDMVGGFNTEMEFMEDIDFIKRLKRKSSFRILRPAVRTSSRKYQRNGMFRLQVIFASIHLLYWASVDPKIISNYYHKLIR